MDTLKQKCKSINSSAMQFFDGDAARDEFLFDGNQMFCHWSFNLEAELRLRVLASFGGVILMQERHHIPVSNF